MQTTEKSHLAFLRGYFYSQIGVCLSNRRGGFPRPPVDFDVILRNGQDRSLRTKWNFHGRAGACSRRGV